MPNTANLALPYPAGTDAVMAGNDAIQALAEAIDNKIHRGQVTTATDASGDITINHGLGAAPTAVLVSNGNATAAYVLAVHTIGAASFKVRCRLSSTGAVVASGGGFIINWLAIA